MLGNKSKMYSVRDLVSVPLAALMYLLSLLPLRFLYFVAGVLSFLLKDVIKYRRSIVRENLHNAFPEKTTEERFRIEKKFYRHFSDVLIEILKLKTLSPATLKKRCLYSPESLELMDRLYREGKSVIIVLGHTGNWEWAGASFPLYNKHQIITAYRPLRNKTFDKYTLQMRKRTGNILASMKSLAREMIRNKKNIIGTGLIADQTPTPNNAFWLNFLNQETPFFKGTELIAQKFNQPVVWGTTKKAGQGYYHINLELITENPREYETPGDLTRQHVSLLERDILEEPESWLWSHKRWKHKRPAHIALVGNNNA